MNEWEAKKINMYVSIKSYIDFDKCLHFIVSKLNTLVGGRFDKMIQAAASMQSFWNNK